MNKLELQNKLAIINFGIVTYFIALFSINYYKIKHVLIGVFVELLTIPFLIAQLVFLVIGIKYLINNKLNFTTKFSLLLLIICMVLTIESFF